MSGSMQGAEQEAVSSGKSLKECARPYGHSEESGLSPPCGDSCLGTSFTTWSNNCGCQGRNGQQGMRAGQETGREYVLEPLILSLIGADGRQLYPWSNPGWTSPDLRFGIRI